MIYKKINLKDEYPQLKYDVILTIICPDNYVEFNPNRVRPGILVIPGGGYNYTSKREGEILALRFLGYDFATFVLEYTCAPNTYYPYPLIEGFAAVDYIRKNMDIYHVDPNRLNVMGFSAGGHLAASLSAYQDHSLIKEYLGEGLNTKIDGCILGYPVITSDPNYYHKGTIENVTKSDPASLSEFFSIEKHVTNKFPRTFIFACVKDPVVPIQNTYLMEKACKEAGVECEVHLYSAPVHGSSLGDRSVYSDGIDIENLKDTLEWPHLAMEFMRR